MSENQHIKMKNVMYELNSFECCLRLTDKLQTSSMWTFRKMRCSTKIKDAGFLTFLSGDNRTNNVDYSDEVLEQDNGKLAYGKQFFCWD